MNNIKLVTIQHRSVLNTLKQGKTYYADFEHIDMKDKLITPYKLMMEHYHYTNCPIFCGVVGKYCEYLGANTTNDPVILELLVPQEEVNLTSYYDWSDVIFFLRYPSEYKGKDSVLDFATDIIAGYNTYRKDIAIQATIPYIKPQWLVNNYKLNKKFLDLHHGSGGSEILRESDYKEDI